MNTKAYTKLPRVIIEVPASDIALKQLVLRDARPLFELIDISRAHLSQFQGDTALKYQTFEDVANSIRFPENENRLRMGIWDNTTLVGNINLTPTNYWQGESDADLGYYLGVNFTGRGYMTRAVVALTNWAFKKYDRLFATAEEENVRSRNVLLNAGYTKIDDTSFMNAREVKGVK